MYKFYKINYNLLFRSIWKWDMWNIMDLINYHGNSSVWIRKHFGMNRLNGPKSKYRLLSDSLRNKCMKKKKWFDYVPSLWSPTILISPWLLSFFVARAILISFIFHHHSGADTIQINRAHGMLSFNMNNGFHIFDVEAIKS